MNLLLTFVHPSRPAKTLGPFETVRFDGGTVRDALERTLIGRQLDHQWEVGGERYFRLECSSRVRIYFEQPRLGTVSRAFGPYERFSAVDGIAYAEDRVFASVDPKAGDWFCYNDGQHWPLMLVTDASTEDRRHALASIAVLAPLVAGVIGLWNEGRLLYLGRAASIRERLQSFAEARGTAFPREFTTLAWERHPDPAAREAELLAQYGNVSHQLVL